MSKKKRKAASAPAANKEPAAEQSAPPGKSHPSPLANPLVIVVLFLILSAAGYTVFHFRKNPVTAVSPAQRAFNAIVDPDYSGVEPQVADKIRRTKDALRANVSSADAWGKLAMNLHVHGFAKESTPCYREAASLAPAEFRWLYYGAVALQETNSPEAADWLKKSVALKPDHAPLRVRYGDVLLDAGKPDDAEREYRAALQKDPALSHARLGLARIALSRGDLDACQTDLRQAIAANPQHSEAHGLLAELYRRRNEMEAAEFEMRILQQLPKETPLPDSQMGDWAAEGVSSYWYEIRGRNYLQKGNVPEAIRELEQAVRARKDAGLHDALGAAYLYDKQFEKAVEQHRLALEINPGSVQAKNNLAAALFEMGRQEEAIRTVEQAMAQHPDAPYSYLHLANLQMRASRPQSAIDALRAGRKNLPDNPRIALQLAVLLATAEDPALRRGAEALQIAESVCKRTGCRDPESQYILAASYRAAGRKEQARQAAQESRRLASQSGNQELIARVDNFLKTL